MGGATWLLGAGAVLLLWQPLLASPHGESSAMSAAEDLASAAEAANATDMAVSETCLLAMRAQQFTAEQLALAGRVPINASFNNMTFTEALVKQAMVQHMQNALPSMDLYAPFYQMPYLGWGNMRVQSAMSASVYVPSANIGEIMHAVNRVMRESALLPALYTRLDTVKTTDVWTKAWFDQADVALDSVGGRGCPDAADDGLSCRSAILRYINYVFTGQFANPTSPESVERLLLGGELFNETMGDFEGYTTRVYSTPFNNGTADAELRTIFAAPVGDEEYPLIVMPTPNAWVMELVYMRYALGALRRGYAVLIYEGPGAGMTPRVPPYMAMHRNNTEVLELVLDTAMADEAIAPKVDRSKVVLVGLESAGYTIGHACVDLPDRLAACVFSPAIPSLLRVRTARTSLQYYGLFYNLSQEHPDFFPDQELVDAFGASTEKIFTPLLNDCPPTSPARKLFESIFAVPGVAPETLQSVMSGMGGGPGRDSPLGLMAHLYPAWKRVLQEVDNPWNPADISVPVLITHGEDDTELAVYSMPEIYDDLPDYIKEVSKVFIFEADTGGALTGQRGAVPVYEQKLYPFLNSTLVAAQQ